MHIHKKVFKGFLGSHSISCGPYCNDREIEKSIFRPTFLGRNCFNFVVTMPTKGGKKNLKKGWMIFTLEKKIDLVWVQIVLCPQEVAFLKTPKSGFQVRVTQKD